MSKTPRTDKNRVRFSTLCHPEDAWWVHETVSAQLEHELNAANERIKRLENVENSHAAVLNAIDNWIQQYKAKEAKL